MDANSQNILNDSRLNSELQRRFSNAVNDAASQGVDVQIHSGFRTQAQQIALYNNRANNSNPVARPGTSPHEYGWAVDATPIPRTQAAWEILWSAARNAGLVCGEDFQTRKDPPHFELPGFQHGSANPLPQSIETSGIDSVIAAGSLGISPEMVVVFVVVFLLIKRIL